MKDFEYYSKVNMEYPNDKDYVNVFVYDKGNVIFKGTWWQWHTIEDNFPSTAVKQELFDLEAYKGAKAAYRKEEQRLHQEFREDIARLFSVQNNPKADLLFGTAWELGHSAGYSEVYHFYQDLVGLIK